MFRVNTNVQSINSQRNLFISSNALSTTMTRLSSGLRIVRAADDAAGLTASETMRGQIAAAQEANRNLSRAISMLQTADSGYEQIGNMLIRLKELATQAADSTLNATNRSAISLEAAQLMQEIDRIAEATTYNGMTLINTVGVDASIPLSFYVGDGSLGSVANQVIYFGIAGVDSNATSGITIAVWTGTVFGAMSVGVTAGNFLNIAQAGSAVDRFQAAINALASLRTNLGAVVNRLERAQANIQVMIENTRNSESIIRDADFAAETAALSRAQILVQAGTSILQQANVLPQNALLLLVGR